MEILGKLGIDVMLLAAQVVNFLILLWILSVFLYKPILKRIDEDENEMKRVGEERKALEEEKVRVQKESAATMKEARARSRKIVELAEEMADQIKAGQPIEE